jgi:large subunit ribosomal protein L25
MANEEGLIAEYREDTGKGSSRRLRHANKVPAIIYGAGREPRALMFNHDDLLRAAEDESFLSSVLKIKIGPNMRRTIIKDIQVHPSKRQIMHIDLQRIVEDEAIKMTIPLHYLNEENAPGVKLGGGSVSKTVTEVEVTCLPKDLPEYIEIDIGEMELDAMLHLTDISLPEGVVLTLLAQDPPQDDAIVSLHVLRVAEEPEEVEEEAVEGEEGEEASTDGKDTAGDAGDSGDSGDSEKSKD